MIKLHKQLELFNKGIFEKAVLIPPFRIMGKMTNEACFYHTVEGETNIISPIETVTTHKSEGVVLSCGNYLNDYIKASSAEYCEIIIIHLYPETLKAIYDNELPELINDIKKIEPVKIRKIEASQLLKNYIDSIQFYFENPELVSEQLLKLKLKELILLLAKTDNTEAIATLVNSLFISTVYDFKKVIEANIYNNLSIDELAVLTNLSLSSFKREFSKVYNQPPARYIKKKKLEKAAKLLSATNQRISDIAYNCGFSDVAHFSKSFLNEYNISPSDYRLEQKK